MLHEVDAATLGSRGDGRVRPSGVRGRDRRSPANSCTGGGHWLSNLEHSAAGCRSKGRVYGHDDGVRDREREGARRRARDGSLSGGGGRVYSMSLRAPAFPEISEGFPFELRGVSGRHAMG